jgi:hypothetical protein
MYVSAGFLIRKDQTVSFADSSRASTARHAWTACGLQLRVRAGRGGCGVVAGGPATASAAPGSWSGPIALDTTGGSGVQRTGVDVQPDRAGHPQPSHEPSAPRPIGGRPCEKARNS